MASPHPEHGRSLPPQFYSRTFNLPFQVSFMAGLVVGTVSYMSPEQGEGKMVDPRSGIFSFGTVLYEMITRRRAFQAGSSLGTLAAILREEPKPASDLIEGFPREVDRVITRCLRKDPGTSLADHVRLEGGASRPERGI